MAETYTENVFEERQVDGKHLCIGIDPVLSKDFEGSPVEAATLLLESALLIAESTRDIAAAFKPNVAFFERYEGGYEAQRLIFEEIRDVAPGVPILWDTKRGDIGNTNKGYLSAAERMIVEGMTVSPYLGGTALKPILEHEGVVPFVLVKTSNPNSGEFQDLELKEGGVVWERVASNVGHGEYWGSLPRGIVVGATYPEAIARSRELAGDEVTILIPGVGTQGGDLEASVKGAANSRGTGYLINVSSGISQPKDGNSNPLPITSENIRAAAINFDQQIREAA